MQALQLRAGRHGTCRWHFAITNADSDNPSGLQCALSFLCLSTRLSVPGGCVFILCFFHALEI